jgi:hypothetical protein
VEGPITASFPTVTPDVAEIRAMALSPDETTVYCWDQAGRGFSVDSATGVATALSADLSAGETAQHATHEDDAPIVYLASFGATEGTTYKYLPLAPSLGLAAFYTPATGQQAHRIGIGEPVVTTGAEVLCITNGSTPGGVWHWVPGIGWTLKNNGLPSGWRWAQVACSPFNRNEWIILGDNGTGVTRTGTALESDGVSVMWHTSNAGATWNPVPVGDIAPAGVIAFDGYYGPLTSIGWVSNNTIFYAGNFGTQADTGIGLWRGTPSGLTGAVIAPPGANGFYSACAGQGGDVVISCRPQRGYVAAGGTTLTPVQEGQDFARITRLDTTTRAIATGYGATWRAHADYRSASTGVLQPLGGNGTAAAGYGFLVNGGRGSNIYRVDDPLGTPTSTLIQTTGATGAAVADATQTVLAVLEGSGSTAALWFTTDGITWQRQEGPQESGLNTHSIAVVAPL